MKATNFAYFLQGYFEVAGEDATLSKQQAEQVLKKAAEVKAGDTPAEQHALTFVGYTQTKIQFAFTSGKLKEATDDIRKELNSLFEHAIDPSYEGDQQQFSDLHKPGRKDPYGHGPGMRC
jgi:hypothetical protein